MGKYALSQCCLIKYRKVIQFSVVFNTMSKIVFILVLNINHSFDHFQSYAWIQTIVVWEWLIHICTSVWYIMIKCRISDGSHSSFWKWHIFLFFSLENHLLHHLMRQNSDYGAALNTGDQNLISLIDAIRDYSP